MTSPLAPTAPGARFAVVHDNSTGMQTFCSLGEELDAERVTFADGQTASHSLVYTFDRYRMSGSDTR
jgi:hypothetical protein